MTWTAIVGDSVPISDGVMETAVTVTNDKGKSITDTFLNNGTVADLTAQVKARIAQRDATTGKLPRVAAGTTLDLSDPAPPAPVVLPDGFGAWLDAWSVYRRVAQLAASGIPSITPDRVEAALTAHQRLYDPAFEALL